MSTSGLRVTRVPPPPLVSRSQRGLHRRPAARARGRAPRTTATDAPRPAVVRSTVGRDRLVAVGQPSGGSLVEPVRGAAPRTRAQRRGRRGGRRVGVAGGPARETNRRMPAVGTSDSMRASNRNANVSASHDGEPHCDERRGEERRPQRGPAAFTTENWSQCVDEVEADRRPATRCVGSPYQVVSRTSSSGAGDRRGPPADTTNETIDVPTEPAAADGEKVCCDDGRHQHREEGEVDEEADEPDGVRDRHDDERELGPAASLPLERLTSCAPDARVRPSVERTRGCMARSHWSAKGESLPTTMTLDEPSRDPSAVGSRADHRTQQP